VSTLAQLSQERIGSSLDAITATFAPGEPLPTRLRAGRDAALAVLRQYVPNFQYDVPKADEAMRDIDAWASRNQAPLEAIMASPAETLPAELALQMGAERAQSFVLSSFTQAAAGLGPWQSGAVARMAAEGDLINEDWARRDADARMQMFALIVKMDHDGDLRSIFVDPTSLQGLGALPVIPLWFILVIVVVFAAALVTGIVLWRRIELNNRLMRDICTRAQAEGDHNTVRLCIEATRDLQVSDVERAASKLVWGVLAATTIYVGLKYVLPWASSLRRAPAATPNLRDWR
jgi:hypothetical protein